MSLKFCANLSFMFQEEASLIKRYSLAASSGFKAVECAWPYQHPIEDVVQIKNQNNLKQILINTPVSNESPGKFGFAAIPNHQTDFINGFQLALKYAKALESSYIHIMSGVTENTSDLNYETYINNIKSALELIENDNISILIEPINVYSVPDYYLNCYDKALKVIKEINNNKLKLMLDLFHLQQISGNLSRNILKLLPYTGHIQVAQVPDRHEPDTEGEMNYSYIFQLLEKKGYEGWIGLEYKPKSDTRQGLKWIQSLGYNL